MHAYVINLDRSPERLVAFQAQAEAAGVAVERLSGVDGSTVSEAEVAAALAQRYRFQPLNRGELGVFLSHREAWRRLIASDSWGAAIFEDDAVLASGLGALLADPALAVLPYDVLKLETGLRPVAISRQGRAVGQEHAVHDLLSWHGGSAGYIVSRGGAARLLQLTEPIADTVDQGMFHPFSAIRRQLRVGQMVPSPVVQRQRLERDTVFVSTIAPARRGRLFRYGPGRDLHRMLRKALEAVQLQLARLRGKVRVIPFEREP